MSDNEVFRKNRVILSHFDSYSTALVFARFGKTLLVPAALPDGAAVTGAPTSQEHIYSGDTVERAAIAHYGLSPAEVVREARFDAWLVAEGDLVRIHLLRFKTFRAPADVIEPHGAVFKPISELRGAPRVELDLVRGVFNLIMGGDQLRG